MQRVLLVLALSVATAGMAVVANASPQTGGTDSVSAAVPAGIQKLVAPVTGTGTRAQSAPAVAPAAAPATVPASPAAVVPLTSTYVPGGGQGMVCTATRLCSYSGQTDIPIVPTTAPAPVAGSVSPSTTASASASSAPSPASSPAAAAAPPAATSGMPAAGVYRGGGSFGANQIAGYESFTKTALPYALDFQANDTLDNLAWPSWMSDAWKSSGQDGGGRRVPRTSRRLQPQLPRHDLELGRSRERCS